MQNFKRFAAGLLFTSITLLVSACGGGGSSSSNSGTGNSSTTVPSSYSTSTAQQSTSANVQAVTVNQGLTGTWNLLTTSVTICVPGTSQCQTIDNIQVDTGSTGLRILSSALNSVTLPAVQSSGGGISGACGVFGSGYTWGAVRTADVHIGGELAGNIPIQVIADSAVGSAPTDCTDNSNGNPMMTTSQLKLNGIMGVGMFVNDCGSSCASNALSGWYYNCPSPGACVKNAQPIAGQIINPVAAFPADNNGLEISLPSLPANGSASVTGTLTFGIGSQANNALGAATVLSTANNSTSYVTSSLNGTSSDYTFLDSGSNGLFFGDSALKQCGSWYCQSASLPITIEAGSSGQATRNQIATSLSVADESTLGQTGNYAFNDIAGSYNSGVDIGLPFFFGRNVFVAIEGRSTPGGPGPFYAI